MCQLRKQPAPSKDTNNSFESQIREKTFFIFGFPRTNHKNSDCPMPRSFNKPIEGDPGLYIQTINSQSLILMKKQTYHRLSHVCGSSRRI